MHFRVHVYPNGLDNPKDSYVLGDIEADRREEVVRVLEAPIQGSNDALIPRDHDYDILPLSSN